MLEQTAAKVVLNQWRWDIYNCLINKLNTENEKYAIELTSKFLGISASPNTGINTGNDNTSTMQKRRLCSNKTSPNTIDLGNTAFNSNSNNNNNNNAFHIDEINLDEDFGPEGDYNPLANPDNEYLDDKCSENINPMDNHLIITDKNFNPMHKILRIELKSAEFSTI